jgi:hypothetical protein
MSLAWTMDLDVTRVECGLVEKDKKLECGLVENMVIGL